MSSTAGGVPSAIPTDQLQEAIRVFDLVKAGKYVADPEKPTEIKDTLKLLQDGTKAGHLDCKYYLAMSIGMGKLGAKKNTHRAFTMLTELATENHALGLYSLACAFRDGYWVPKSTRNIEQAYRLFEQLSECSQILPGRSPWNELQLLLPHTRRGRQMSEDELTAASLKILETGSEKNDAASLHNLSMVYINGQLGQSVDEPRAVELEKRAAQSDCVNGKHAKWNLGMWHKDGSYGLEKSWSIVEDLWLKADNHDALHSLGLAYEPDFPRNENHAKPSELSDKKALQFYTRAANEFGNVSSMCNLVNFYDGHKPFPEFLPDPYEAIRLMSVALERGVGGIAPQLERFIAKVNMEVLLQSELLRPVSASDSSEPEIPEIGNKSIRGWKAELSVIDLMADDIVTPNLELAQYYRNQAVDHGAPADEIAEIDRVIEGLEQALQPAEKAPSKRRRAAQKA